MPSVVIPDPALVILVGPSGSGKSTWASSTYGRTEIVSSDHLRGVVGSGEHDLDASADAFAVLDQIVAARLRRGLNTVIDTLGFDAGRRRAQRDLADLAGLPAVAMLFGTSPSKCRARNRQRDRQVPAAVLDAQFRRMRTMAAELAGEGWTVIEPSGEVTIEPSHSAGIHSAGIHSAGIHSAGINRPDSYRAETPAAPAQLEFVLQISRFPWNDDPAGWLIAVANAAAEAGLSGLALMDHLIQIPQVGRAWEPIPEPWVTLGLLAGVTPRLKLGTLVSPVTFRPPGVLAKMVATLDALSGGRVFCGLGAGWWEREHAAFGLPFPPARDRLDQLERTIETLRALWSPGTRPFTGQHVSLPETTSYPRPAGQVPIIVGGAGNRTLKIAATLADACNLPASRESLDRTLPVLRELCARAGREPRVTVLDLPVIGRARADTSALTERLRGRTSAAAFTRSHHAGTAADHIGRYRQLAERGVSTVFVSLPDLTGPEEIYKLAPVTAAFA
jgi:alkanesulfonate monooxygenase SsuD/methylene tetrahydromethanopterin reductase-like flavin-dependent oxidoreductase (luciferase family)/predicted kinase